MKRTFWVTLLHFLHDSVIMMMCLHLFANFPFIPCVFSSCNLFFCSLHIPFFPFEKRRWVIKRFEMNMQWSNIKECHTERNMLHIQCKHTVCLFFLWKQRLCFKTSPLSLDIVSFFHFIAVYFSCPVTQTTKQKPCKQTNCVEHWTV